MSLVLLNTILWKVLPLTPCEVLPEEETVAQDGNSECYFGKSSNIMSLSWLRFCGSFTFTGLFSSSARRAGLFRIYSLTRFSSFYRARLSVLSFIGLAYKRSISQCNPLSSYR
jgi:hypothetical protein